MTVGISGGSAVAVDTQTIDLHNNDAPSGADCPDDVNDFWHFVLTPNNDTFSFVSITLDLEGAPTFYGAVLIISNGGQPDNVWVQVPNGYTFASIVTAGSSAEVSPAIGDVTFVLSHLCDGTGTTTTTTTTVAQNPPTTTALSAASASTTTLVTELPRTGLDDSGDLALIGAVLMLLGGIMLLGTRRPVELV